MNVLYRGEFALALSGGAAANSRKGAGKYHRPNAENSEKSSSRMAAGIRPWLQEHPNKVASGGNASTPMAPGPLTCNRVCGPPCEE